MRREKSILGNVARYQREISTVREKGNERGYLHAGKRQAVAGEAFFHECGTQIDMPTWQHRRDARNCRIEAGAKLASGKIVEVQLATNGRQREGGRPHPPVTIGPPRVVRAMTLTAPAVRRRLRALAVPGNVAILRRFFKTGPGEYGEASPHAANRAALRDRAVSRVRAQAVPDRSGLNVELFHQLIAAVSLMKCSAPSPTPI